MGDLLFFDLETTGLGGAGTVAFLAAFGRLIVPEGAPMEGRAGGPWQLRVDQYLLLDFPGEDAFLEALLPEFGSPGFPGEREAENPRPVVVSYNGKAFDTPLLRTRCLMKGIRAPRSGYQGGGGKIQIERPLPVQGALQPGSPREEGAEFQSHGPQ
jgi:hypothetical protein